MQDTSPSPSPIPKKKFSCRLIFIQEIPKKVKKKKERWEPAIINNELKKLWRRRGDNFARKSNYLQLLRFLYDEE